MVHHARHADVDLPILQSILPSNDEQVQRVIDLITAADVRRVGLFGLGFKAGTDDLRESPLVELAEKLLGRGFELLIYDNQVSVSRLLGANRAYVEERIPHLSRLMAASAESVAVHGDVCVLGTPDPDAIAAIQRANSSLVIDLVRPEGAAASPTVRVTSALRGKGGPVRVLILDENLSVPFDRRVWNEARTLASAGYEVDVVCPCGEGRDLESYVELEA